MAPLAVNVILCLSNLGCKCSNNLPEKGDGILIFQKYCVILPENNA